MTMERRISNEMMTHALVINYVYALTHVFPKCFKSLHTLLGFAPCFVSSISILVAVTIYSILTCTRMSCTSSPCENGSFEMQIDTSVDSIKVIEMFTDGSSQMQRGPTQQETCTATGRHLKVQLDTTRLTLPIKKRIRDVSWGIKKRNT